MQVIDLSNTHLVALVDDIDLEDVLKFKWYLKIDNHVSNGDFDLHILIAKLMGLTLSHFEIDHKDRNGRNNQRENLRLATHTQNSRNKCVMRSSTTGYKGVSFHTKRYKYRAVIHIGSRHIHIGYYSDPVEAAKAYDRMALKYFGEFAYLNFTN